MKFKEMGIIYKLSKLFTPKEIRKLTLLFLATLIMGFLEVIGVASIAPFMAVVSNPELIRTNEYLWLGYQHLGFENDNYFLITLGCLVLVAMTISNGYTALMNGWTIYFSNMQGHYLSMRLMQKYMAQPYIFYLNRNTADLSKNILAEVYRCVGGVVLPTIQACAKIVTTLFIFIFLLILDPVLAVSVVFVLGTAYAILFGLARHHVNKIGRLSTAAVLERYKIASEALSGIKDLKLSGREAEFLNRFATPSDGSARYSAQAGLIAALPKYALEIVAFGGIVSIVIYLISVGENSGHVIPLISLYALAGYRLMPALQLIYANLTRIKYNLPALEIILKDLSDGKEDDLEAHDNCRPLAFEREIRLENLLFFYPNSHKPVLHELDLKIQSNTTIGLVGTTGSGKTTLIDIVLGLLTPESGSIAVDDIQISSENIHAWQKNIGYVPQTIYLSDDTVANNIAFALPDNEIDMHRVVEAAKIAELDDFIESLSEQYQTIVGERGVRLSGGQRQRIGIARALYHDPKVLVLDEATSSLDGITENVIMDAIQNLSHKKTIIMIAHRLTTVKACDVIHVMKEGKIVDSGTYNELLASNIQFYKMANA